MPGVGKVAGACQLDILSPLRDQRITTKSEFSNVFAARQNVANSYVKLHYAPATGPARLGLAVAKRLTRTAVQRNRIRRQLNEAFRNQAHALHGLHIVATLRRPCRASAQAREVGQQFRELLDSLTSQHQ